MTDSANNAEVLVSEFADDADMIELVEMFVDELPGKALAIRQAMEKRDMEVLGRLAHQLKGAAGGYGFPTITDAAGELEMTTKADRVLDKLEAEVKQLIALCERARATAPGKRVDG
ncbi:MAG: Hpt domain-containing protein [Phycisphaerae bacterium]|nr:Hpt domain-containing protein [Phycisphaerae bacterium]